MEVDTGAGTEQFLGRRVTICAGAIGTPAIMMRSGIGARAALERIAIPVVVDSPGVGANLIDHPVIMVVARAKAAVRSRSRGLLGSHLAWQRGRFGPAARNDVSFPQRLRRENFA